MIRKVLSCNIFHVSGKRFGICAALFNAAYIFIHSNRWSSMLARSLLILGLPAAAATLQNRIVIINGPSLQKCLGGIFITVTGHLATPEAILV